MNHFLRSQVLNSRNQLPDIISNLNIRESLSALQHIVKTQIRTQLKNYIHVVLILKVLLQHHYPLMIHTLVNFDLTHQLEFCSLFCKRSFFYYFHSELLARIRICQLKTPCKTSFSKEFAFDVLFLCYDSTRISDFLINRLKLVSKI